LKAVEIDFDRGGRVVAGRLWKRSCPDTGVHRQRVVID